MSGLDEVKDLAEAVAQRRSLMLWDVEMGGRSGQSVVRIFVDSEDGVDLDTVAQVSEELSRGLDLRDSISGRYTLEVSTPGLERNLKSPEHFKLSVGRDVVVKTSSPLMGDTNRIEGLIASADNSGVVLEVDGDEVQVPYDVIKTARTVFEWKRG
ncbi:MAG TPA: ribosome maturation factor RimP [Actinomycetota bacterium]|nr:ribosome maturation factor RimP [Actinomycetota bacterium]